MADRVFLRLTVEAHFHAVTDGRVLVTWALMPTFSGEGPYTFTLQRGYAANDDKFEDIAQTVDQPWLYDNRPVLQTMNTQLYYRVKLDLPNGESHISQAAPLQSYWDSYDWRLAREIIRKETLLLRRKGGTKGWLLKRRVWGNSCPACVSEGGHVTNVDCQTCYGTGVEGGYYLPFEYWALINPGTRVQKLDKDSGIIADVVKTVRGLAYPQPEANDVWVQYGTDQRYLIMPDISPVASHRGIDLVLNLRLKEQPRSSSIYLIPLSIT